MKHTTKLALAAASALAASVAAPGSAQAQSADTLIDKLVEKGILTSKEAQNLRDEADKDFTRAYQAKSGLPDWVTALRIGGDVRLRYDGIYMDPPKGSLPTSQDRNRMRYRLRVGITATMMDDFEVGMRLTSAENKAAAGATPAGDPISGNDTMTGNGSKKLVWIDLAYAKWNAINSPDWSMTWIGGKMENPFQVSEIVFDPDYTPEGIGFQLGYNISDKQALKFNGGLFSVSELNQGAAGPPLTSGSKDTYLYGAQLRWEAAWDTKLSSSLGVGVYGLSDKQNLGAATIPNVSQGNTRFPAGNPLAGVPTSAFNPIATDASVTYTLESFPYYPGAFPVKVMGEYINNVAGSTIPLAGTLSQGAGKNRNEAYSIGLTLGKSGKKGTWDLTYKWKNLEANYWYEEVVDSDHGAWYTAAPTGGAAGYGAGTNIRGHYMRAAYSPTDSLTLACTYYLFDLIDKPAGATFSQAGRIQIDAAFKF